MPGNCILYIENYFILVPRVHIIALYLATCILTVIIIFIEFCIFSIYIFESLSQFPLGHSRGSSHGHSRIIRKSYVQKHYAAMMPEAYCIWDEIEELNGGEKILL